MNLWSSFFLPDKSLFRFIIGTAALTVGINIFYDAFKEPFGLLGAVLLAGSLLALVILIVSVQYWRIRRWQSVSVAERSDVTPHKGLILSLSPGGLELGKTAIEHHLPSLRHCWVVCSRESLASADQLTEHGHANWKDVSIHSGQDYLVDPFKFESTREIIERIYAIEAPAQDLMEADVLTDITAGPKPMTTGMALACTAEARDMQYINTPRNKHGEVIEDAPRLPMIVSTRRLSQVSEKGEAPS